MVLRPIRLMQVISVIAVRITPARTAQAPAKNESSFNSSPSVNELPPSPCGK
jgi:hypothetical protein